MATGDRVETRLIGPSQLTATDAGLGSAAVATSREHIIKQVILSNTSGTDRLVYLGIGGVLTYKNAGLVEVIEKIGLQHLVLETDAPYLSPVPFRGKRNESSYLVHVIDKLTEVLKISREEIIDITTLNAQKIFGV
jgi:Tat protein secretion system quality control protein TatD with DNase activity